MFQHGYFAVKIDDRSCCQILCTSVVFARYLTRNVCLLAFEILLSIVKGPLFCERVKAWRYQSMPYDARINFSDLTYGKRLFFHWFPGNVGVKPSTLNCVNYLEIKEDTLQRNLRDLNCSFYTSCRRTKK